MKNGFDLDKHLCKKLDDSDPLRKYRKRFLLPRTESGSQALYFCGNSLGLQPKTVKNDVDSILNDWADKAVKGHSHAEIPWMQFQDPLKEKMAKIVGASPDELAFGNTLSINLHLLFVSFYRPTQKRYKVLMENKAFPSDSYIVASQMKFRGFDPSDGILLPASGDGGPLSSTEDFLRCIDENREELALILISGLNYYSGQLFDIKAISDRAKKYGIKIGLDLAHVAGNVEVNLHALDVDFAAWCTYKYLNGGPGSLAGLFVHRQHLNENDIPRFEGWWGNRLSSRFEMRNKIDPWETAEAWIPGNTPILAIAPLKSSLELFDNIGMPALRRKSIKLTSYLEFLINSLGEDRIELITPSNSELRGCQLSMFVKNKKDDLFNELMSAGVILDWREPGVIRVAPTPMYNSFTDVYQFYLILKKLLDR